ncbi:MAG: hypothetical protein U1D06_00910, partial [Paracoccaceae bacterium]|nr:hypothetical protein [Paracoccaceae bacterium]
SHLTNLPPETVPSGALTQLVAGGIAAQRAIEADAFALGARLFTGDAKVMANLWADWWAIWRAEGQCAPAKAPESPASISAIVSCTP